MLNAEAISNVWRALQRRLVEKQISTITQDTKSEDGLFLKCRSVTIKLMTMYAISY